MIVWVDGVLHLFLILKAQEHPCRHFSLNLELTFLELNDKLGFKGQVHYYVTLVQ